MTSLYLKTNRVLKILYITIFIVLFFSSFLSVVHALEGTHYTKQWIRNSDFSLGDDSWVTSVEGDESDLNASIYSEQGKFEIYGEQRSYSLIADPPLALDWSVRDNPNFPDRPDIYEITSVGCNVSHQFDDITALQSPSVHWDQNISLPVNMSDYQIKSASIQAIVNATVDENLDRLEDYLTSDRARLNPDYDVDTYSIGDYIRFYVLISDLEKNQVFEIAYFQTAQIGNGNPPGKDYLYDTSMHTVTQEILVFYLGAVLGVDNSNFTLTLGIRIHIEDNLASYWDQDNFDELLIKSVNFNFTYEKIIDRYSSVSLNQIGASINGTNVEIRDAILNFKFKIDEIWPESLSPNSELTILINNYEIEKKIKLSEMNTSFQEMTIEKSDIKAFILTNINISVSIRVVMADDFVLDRVFTISVDDTYLIISYTIFREDTSPNYYIWVILIILFIVIAILGSLSLRSYVLVPRKLNKRNALLSRTQKFKDAESIQGILLIHNDGGLPLFSKNYSELLEGKNTLFSGFIQAVSLVGEEMSLKKKIRSKGVHKDLVDGIHDVVELDFKHFYCLISDIEELRTVLILSNKASKRLKRQILNFGLSVYAKYAEDLKQWDGDLTPFKEDIPILINNYFNLHYKDFFKLTINRSDLESTKKEYKLSRNDLKVLNEILTISEEEKIFKLITLLEKMSERSEDMIIDSIEALMKNNIVIPAGSISFQD